MPFRLHALLPLRARSSAEEEMDDPGLDPALYRRALTDLAALNRATGTHRPALRWLRRAVSRAGLREFSVLDVACGHGDHLREIGAAFPRAALTGIDLNPRAVALASEQTPPGREIAYVSADIFDYAPDRPPDFIVSSQFFHHLPDDEIVLLLQRFDALARHGWIVTDLHRNIVPYLGYRFLARALRLHRIVRVDGTISIARGFRRAEWRALLRRAGIAAEIRWHVPFRHSIARLK